MKQLTSAIFLLALTLVLSCLQACGSKTQDVEGVTKDSSSGLELKFGVYTTDRPTDVVRQFRPLLNALELELKDELKRPVSISMVVADSYEKGIEDLVEGEVDFSRFGPASFVLSTEQDSEISLLAQEANEGEVFFYGIICAQQGGDVREVADLKGHSFAFGSEQSTIGRYLSQLHLAESGIKASDLASFEYLGRHDTVGTAVAQGRFAGGALKESTFQKLVNKGEPLIEIARFKNITKPWAGRSGLAPEISSALTGVLLELDDPVALEAIGKSGFVAGDISRYGVTREAILSNDQFFEGGQ